MIQVCSRCATRWNVRDRQRVWCPRCQGALLAPTVEAPQPQWAPPAATAAQPGASRPARRLPAGYRWIAVRPGAPPPPARATPPLGPTPRYDAVPRWGLQDRLELPPEPARAERPSSSPRFVAVTVTATVIVLGLAALVHIADYGLLLYNRNTLLNPIVAGIATWGGVAISVLAFFALIASTVALTGWLVSRRAAAYGQQKVADPRPPWQLWVGSLVPIVNLFWAPVFVFELARVEGRLTHLRSRIVAWWCGWLVSALVSVFSIATSFTRDAQGIANNTVATVIAYLTALAAVLLVLRVYDGFERRSVDRPVKRWVIVGEESPRDHSPKDAVAAADADGPADDESSDRVESERVERAALAT